MNLLFAFALDAAVGGTPPPGGPATFWDFRTPPGSVSILRHEGGAHTSRLIGQWSHAEDGSTV